MQILENLSNIYDARSKNDWEFPLAEQVYNTRVRFLGTYHPDTIYSLNNLGVAYRDAGEQEKALAAFQQAAAGFDSNFKLVTTAPAS